MDIIYSIGTVLGIVAVMVLRDLRDGKVPWKRNTGMREDIGHLRDHYNDEITALLTDIKENGEKTNDKLENMHDCLKKANNKLDNMEKYGVKPLKE